MNEQRQALRNHSDETLYSKKRDIEKATRNSIKTLREDYDTSIEKAKQELRARLQAI